MSLTSDANSWIERLARAGYTAKGVVYLLIGLLAFQAAIGTGGNTSGTPGALRLLLRQPLGRWLLGLVAVGLAGYALWRAVSAIADPESHGRHGGKRLFVRAGYAGSAVLHGALALQAARLALGRGGAGGEGAESWTARLMSAPLGQWLVGLAAVGVAGYGLVQVVQGLRGEHVAKRLAFGGLGGDERRLLLRTARAGMVARGIVFGIMGLFLAHAALEHDPREAGGLGEALEALERQPYAPFLLGAVALGLAAYGVFQLVKARYRVISPA